ncbi:52 kDa repressor of the inhibitor of the protein kinase-like [Denticeps clupeoides]|uniref:THAP-type domain-containing protein n=1 Tax=Denticeps clupeoides TaxID=299321 RepID=A0AAY4AK99_9TELE|nr:52 kDa repressor of the inhibitor of the protein kinase-like [Denticeps clupeoides]
MPNFCAAPNCTRKSTQSDLAFFRFPRDPDRCRLWVENCRRADLETKTSEQLNKHYRLCARHFEPAMICRTSPYRTVLRDSAVPTIFDLTSHLNNPHSRHRKRIKELTEEDIRRLKERRLESSVEQLHSKQEKRRDSEPPRSEPQLTPQQQEFRHFLRAAFEIVLLSGRRRIPLAGPGRLGPSNFQALLEVRMNAGDAPFGSRFDACAVNVEYCSADEQERMLELCEQSVREGILRDVRESRFFSLVTGDPAEFPGGAQLPLCLRFVDRSGALREELVDFVPFEADCGAMAERLQAHVAQRWGLSMAHCRGQAHAGSGAFTGQIRAVAVRLMEAQPAAVLTPSSTHALNVQLASCVPLTGVKVVMATLRRISSFFQTSPLLLNQLHETISILFKDNPEKSRELRQLDLFSWTEMHGVFQVALDLLEPFLRCMDSVHDNKDVKWSGCITSEACSIAEVLADFEFIVTLVVLKNALSFTRAFGKNIQGDTLDIFFAASSLTAVLHSLNEVIDNIEVYHEFWFEESVNVAAAIDVPVRVPRLFLRKQRDHGGEELQPEFFFKDYLTIPLMQCVARDVKDLFSESHLKALKCLSLVPAIMGQMKFNTSEESHAEVYRSDLPNPDTLPAELHCWRIKWKHRGKEVGLPGSIHETLQLPDVKFFPNVSGFLKVLSMLPVLKLQDKRHTSALKRLRTYLYSTPLRYRSRRLATLSAGPHATPDLLQVVDQYMKVGSEKETRTTPAVNVPPNQGSFI